MPNLYEQQLPPGAMVSTEGPVSMGRSWNPFGRLFGPRDVELPNESGMADPRIPQPLEALRKAFDAANAIASEKDSLKGLQKAGRGY